MKLSDFKNLRFLDLTHELTAEVPCWEGGCGFNLTTTAGYAESGFEVQQISMHAGIGTHMDAPAHCIPGGASISDLPLAKLIAPCIKIDISHKAHENYQLSLADIKEFEIQHGEISPGSFCLVYTGWEKYWPDPKRYRNDLKFPSISKSAGEYLLMREVVGLGIDTLSPDLPDSGYPVHQIILGAGKYIVENIANAKTLPAIGSYILALPMKVKNGTEAPLRLIAITA